MIVRYDDLNRLERPLFTLCNPSSEYNNGLLSKVVGILTDTEAEEIVFNFNATSELNLRINRVRRDNAADNAHAYSLYKAVQNRRLLFVENIGYFMISNVADNFDGFVHYKDITAQSIDSEIAQKCIPYISDGTYRFLTDDTGTNKGILDMIVETIPLWTIGYVDATVAEKWRTFEDLDASLNCLSFLLSDVQDAYECIILFDCIHRTINVYAQDNYIRQTDIHVTKDDLINSLDITENADDLYTAISVLGDDDVTISAINPLGTNVIYDFSYYYSWMSDVLSAKVKAWQEAVEAARASYYEANLNYYTELTTINNLKLEIQALETQITMYKRCKENIIAESGTTLVSSYNDAIVASGGSAITVHKEISDTLAEINSLIEECEAKIDSTNNTLSLEQLFADMYKKYIDEVHMSLDMLTYFTAEEYAELNHYIFEGSYSDEHVVITEIMTYEEKFSQMETLYNRAKDRLERVAHPTREFTIDVENFVFQKEFAEWSRQLETGCLINVELDINDIALLFLSNITINYDDRTLSMTFGNRFNKFDPKSLFDNVLGQITKSANTLSYIKDVIYPIKSGEFNAMKEAVQTSRNLTMGQALASTNERVVIDGSGYTGRSQLENGTYDPRQVKLTGRNLVFTDDAWESCKVAIGELLLGNGVSTYGINAKAIIGDLIMGNNLRILDNNGNDMLTVVDGKIEAYVGKVEGDVETLTEAVMGDNGLSVRVTTLENTDISEVTTTTGYKFGAEGLTIHKSGEEITNKLDNTGMYVSRGEGDTQDIILEANNLGVDAINLTARQYLIVGTNSRFENYTAEDGSGRTGCFFIGDLNTTLTMNGGEE